MFKRADRTWAPEGQWAAVKDAAERKQTQVKQVDYAAESESWSAEVLVASTTSCRRRRWTGWRILARNSAMIAGVCDSDVAGAPR
jgi:hypothetical protein